jgi:hypothetical protein
VLSLKLLARYQEKELVPLMASALIDHEISSECLNERYAETAGSVLQSKFVAYQRFRPSVLCPMGASLYPVGSAQAGDMPNRATVDDVSLEYEFRSSGVLVCDHRHSACLPFHHNIPFLSGMIRKIVLKVWE